MWRGLSAVPVWPGSPHYEDVCGGCDAALRHHYCSNLLVIYTVVFLSVVVSGFFTVLYSMEWVCRPSTVYHTERPPPALQHGVGSHQVGRLAHHVPPLNRAVHRLRTAGQGPYDITIRREINDATREQISRVTNGRSRGGQLPQAHQAKAAKQPHQYFMTNEHKNEYDKVCLKR